MQNKHFHLHFNLIIAFIIPVIIMGIYFAYRQMAPFGSNSILTVDLGQQYVDFFAYFRNIFLHHPSSLLYSFSKGLGGEMWGTNSYYLFSPLNFILLFFPGKFLSSGILLLLLVKYGLAGLAFCWLLEREHLQSAPRCFAFSTAYALMGWMIANQLNILWLDVLFILPPVIAGLLQLSRDGSPWLYISWLTFAMIDNYYMAWMISLFTILFVLWLAARQTTSWRAQLRFLVRYLMSSLRAALLSAIVLLPTIYSLTQSKGTYTEQKIKWVTEYHPVKILAKLVPGSFNFSQMPSGQPNIYVGMLMTIGALLYFIHSKDRWQAKIVAFIITIFLVCSFFLQPLDLLWHLGQFPVWYPSRFSFVFCFWIIWLAAVILQPNFSIKWSTALGLTVLLLICGWSLVKQNKNISYINGSQIALGAGFFAITVILLMLHRHDSPRLMDALFVLLAILDVTTSAFVSLNHLSYVSQPEFGNYTTAMNDAVRQTKSRNHSVYRIAKNFMRTKDDPFQADYYGGEHFGSTMEPTVSAFMGSTGNPSGDGFITYSNGTQVTDSLLGFKYFLQARHHGEQNGNSVLPITSTRADWNHVTTKRRTKLVNIKQNSSALPLAFGASKLAINQHLVTLDPLNYQSQIFQSLAGHTNVHPLFEVQNFDRVNFTNVQEAKQITGTTFTKSNPLSNASVTLHFTPTSNDSYYLTLGPNVKSVANIELNGHQLDQYPTYHNTIVVNVASQAKGKPISIKFTLKKQAMWLQNVSLYKLNQSRFQKSLHTLQQEPLHITHHCQNQIQGTVTIKKAHHFLMTTIPAAPGWHVQVDGQTAHTFKVFGTFMGIPIAPGTHHVTMTFIPPLLILGTIISGITIIVSGSWEWYRRRY